MRIVHCCLANFYIDDYGYQENILPRMHQLQGHDVSIVASTETYVDNVKLGYTTPGSYRTADGIPITRLPYSVGLPLRLAAKLRLYRGVHESLCAVSPDIIFLHDCQFLSITDIVRYVKRRPHVRVYVDGHTDFGNSAKTWLSRHVLHGIIYRYCARVIEPYAAKFYGVLPARVEFFKRVYGISEDKVELLVLGADDTRANLDRRAEIRAEMRTALGIAPSDFVLVSGGKLDRRKNIHRLMQAVRAINRADLKLLLLGKPNDDMRGEVEGLANHPSIRYVGWVAADDIYRHLLAADLGVFPGTHSVLWEQAVGVGLPCLFRSWPGMRHVDLGGNCVFLESGSVDDVQSGIMQIYADPDRFQAMRTVAIRRGIPEFSYYRIAERAIEAV